MDIVLIAHNIRSIHNVGSLLRTAEGLGIKCVYLTGYTPYPTLPNDSRLPHISQKISQKLSKTSLGAEKTVPWMYSEDIFELIEKLKMEDYVIAALEQSSKSIPLPEYKKRGNIAVIVGREVEGIESEVISLCDTVLEIPMFGSKESYNVSVAAGMALYQLRFVS